MSAPKLSDKQFLVLFSALVAVLALALLWLLYMGYK